MDKLDESSNFLAKTLGDQARKIGEWRTDSELTFNITYQIEGVDLDLWRDRGLYSILLSPKSGRMFHITEKFECLDGHKDLTGEIEELEPLILTIVDKLPELTRLFEQPGIEEKLDKTGDYRSIPRIHNKKRNEMDSSGELPIR